MSRPHRPCSQKGFTLIELLLVASIVLTVSMALTAFFVQGARIYGRFEHVAAQENEAFLLERLTRDLKNARPTSLAPFQLNEEGTELSFGVLSAGPESGSDPSAPSAVLSRVTYRMDPGTHEIQRVETDVYSAQGSSRTDILLPQAAMLRFETFPEDSESISMVTVMVEVPTRSGTTVLRKSIVVPVTL